MPQVNAIVGHGPYVTADGQHFPQMWLVVTQVMVRNQVMISAGLDLSERLANDLCFAAYHDDFKKLQGHFTEQSLRSAFNQAIDKIGGQFTSLTVYGKSVCIE